MAPDAAVGLAVPFALLGQYAVTLTFTFMAPMMAVADKHAEDANPQGIVHVNYISMAILGSLFAVIVAIGMISGEALGHTLAAKSVELSWLMAGLDVAGGMMRYVGFAVLMNIMISGDLWAFYFLGFGLAVLITNIPNVGGAALLLLTFIGAAIAITDFNTNTKLKNATISGGDEDGI